MPFFNNKARKHHQQDKPEAKFLSYGGHTELAP